MSVSAQVITTNHGGAALGQPLDQLPNISYTFVRSDKGSASWSVPFSHPRLLRNREPNSFGPKRTDFYIEITRDNGTNWTRVFGGICAAVGLDSDRSTVEVTGVDWLEWLDQAYRFNAYTSTARTAADVVKKWTAAAQKTIINDLVANMWSGDPYFSVLITNDFLGTGWGDVPAAAIMVGDGQNVLDHIRMAGAYNEPYGFEFWMTQDKVLHLSSPRRMTSSSAPIFGFYGLTLPPNVSYSQIPFTHVTWTNTGPKAVTTIGKLFGNFTSYSDAPVTAATFRDWWQIVQLKSTTSLKQKDIEGITTSYQAYLNRLTEAVGNRDRNPQHTVSLTFQPEATTAVDFFDNQVGQLVHVDSDSLLQPYERINAAFWIQSQTLKCDDVGNWLCDLVLEQAYT